MTSKIILGLVIITAFVVGTIVVDAVAYAQSSQTGSSRDLRLLVNTMNKLTRVIDRLEDRITFLEESVSDLKNPEMSDRCKVIISGADLSGCDLSGMIYPGGFSLTPTLDVLITVQI